MRPSTLFSVCLAAGLSVAAPIERRARSGTATFFAVGLGNCGWQNSPSDHIVAVSTDIYGSTSQKSGLCGQTVHITNTNTGQSATATVADSCPSCGGAGDLDMSTGLFKALGGTTEEGVFPITWSLGGDSSPSPKPSSSPKPKPSPASSNNNSDNNRVANNGDSSSSSSSAQPAAPTIPANWSPFNNSTANGFYYNATGFSNQTVSGLPAWWAEIDTASCNITAAANETYVAIAPSDNIRNSIKLKFTSANLHTESKNSRAYPTICGGLRRGARKQLWKGVTMSKEAIHVVQKLKLAKSSKTNEDDDSNSKMDQVFNSSVGRLLNGDLILVLEELRRQNELQLALKVFDYMRKDETFKCDICFYNDMILMLGKNGLIEKAEKLFSEIKIEGLEPDTRAYTEMMGAYLKCKMMDKAMNMYTMMKDSGCSPDKLTLTILLKNLEKAGEKELVSVVKKDCEKYIERPESFLEEISKTYPSRRSLKIV